MQKVGIFPVFYFPSVAYFYTLLQYEKIIFEGEDNYQKQTYRNRSILLGANGKLSLSIPIERNGKRKANTKCMSSSSWKKHHWKSIESAYRSSPYFEYYEDALYYAFMTRKNELYAYNIHLMNFLFQKLDYVPDYHISTEYIKQPQPKQIDYRNSFSPKHIYPAFFPKYIQVFSDRFPFHPNLSILDLLFCLGPQAKEYLKTIQIIPNNITQ